MQSFLKRYQTLKLEFYRSYTHLKHFSTKSIQNRVYTLNHTSWTKPILLHENLQESNPKVNLRHETRIWGRKIKVLPWRTSENWLNFERFKICWGLGWTPFVEFDLELKSKKFGCLELKNTRVVLWLGSFRQEEESWYFFFEFLK